MYSQVKQVPVSLYLLILLIWLLVEEEAVTFSSQGKVTTADGREITFSLEMGMSRTFEQYYREEYDMTEFQRLYGIPVSGAVGPVTWSQIAKEYDSLQNNI